jgi:hypothetical protein
MPLDSTVWYLWMEEFADIRLHHNCHLPQLEATEQLHSAITSAAPGLGMTADVLTQLFDKSLPTMIGTCDTSPLP